jgi:peptide deformylase
MAVLPIVQLGDPVLRLPGMEVVRFDRALGQLIDDMIDTMRAASGVGLFANQVGRREQVAVIEIEGQVRELVNPRLVRATGDATDLEGCLSVAGYYGPVTRRARVVATARDRRGRRIRIAGEDLLARVLQH